MPAKVNLALAKELDETSGSLEADRFVIELDMVAIVAFIKAVRLV